MKNVGYRRLDQFPIVGERGPQDILLGYEYEIDPGGITQYNEPKDKPWKNAIIHEQYIYTWESLMAPVHGFEVKSFIGTLKAHRPVVAEFLAKTTFNTKPNGQNTNAGGIHVNIDNTNIDEDTRRKVFQFFHHTNNYPFLLALSRRDPHCFTKYAAQTGNGRDPNIYSKYTTITLHKINNGKGPYELRMWAAQPDLLIPALEFSEAVFKYGKTLKADQEITPVDITMFCSDHPEYQEAARICHAAL